MELRNDLEYLQQNGELPSNTSMFDEGRIPTFDQLTSRRDVFRTKSPLGRAISALSLDIRARDWVTGEEMTPGTVRQLESDNQLDRHHVFPRKALTRGEDSLDRHSPLINHGLNIVLLRKKANITLGGKEPAVYLSRLLETNADLTEEELISRINSHMSPYDLLLSQDGSLPDRYDHFLTRRAEMLQQLIERL